MFFSLWIVGRERSLMLMELKREAEAIYRYSVVTRHWIANHKGVYVKKGDEYQLLTPYKFTREFTDYSKERLPYRVKMALLEPTNPTHKADDFEAMAIKSMAENGGEPMWRLEESPEGPVFRFAAPLRFTKECINCHKYYQTNIPACISVTIPASKAMEVLKKDKVCLFLIVLVFMLVIFAIVVTYLRLQVLEPLSHFVEASNRVSEGDLSIRLDEKRRDEWGKLAKNFNAMIEKILSHRKEMEEEIRKATERVECAYRELKETESFKSEFFSNITHDLKTPITAIKGAVDLLARKEGVVPYVEVIKKNIDKLSKMIGDLLDCARLESGKLEMNMEYQDLVEVVEETVFITDLLAKQKDVTIKLEKEMEEVELPFDGDRISQVIANLLSNAIKFSPKGSEVVVRVGIEGSWAVVSVEDHGPGIPKNEREKVFEKFYRVKRGDEPDGSTGLGLAICKGIVDAHGGRIEITDPPDHKGTKVSFFLPLNRKE